MKFSVTLCSRCDSCNTLHYDGMPMRCANLYCLTNTKKSFPWPSVGGLLGGLGGPPFSGGQQQKFADPVVSKKTRHIPYLLGNVDTLECSYCGSIVITNRIGEHVERMHAHPSKYVW